MIHIIIAMVRAKPQPSKRVEAFETLCRQQGLPLTVQRRFILEALLNRADHPTADQIFDDVKQQIPGLSRNTVYRVLETLVRLGVARKTNHIGAAVRFDPNTERHHHLVCLECGSIADLSDPTLDTLPLPDVRRGGFEVTDYSVYLTGICSQCRRKRARPRRAQRRKGVGSLPTTS